MSIEPVSRHPRGHLADCNVPLNRSSVRVEHHHAGENEEQSTVLLETEYFQTAKQKLVKLSEFQRKVKQRVERRKRKDLNECPVLHVACPVAVSEVWNEKTAADDGEVTVLLDGATTSREARRRLLQVTALFQDTPSANSRKDCHTARAYNVHDNDVLVRRKPQKVQYVQNPEGSRLLATRRLYSALERQHCRVNAARKQQRTIAQKQRHTREEQRRKLESDSCKPLVTLAPVPSDEYQRREEWEGLLALEDYQDGIRQQREMERFSQASCYQLKERLQQAGVELPRLCACQSSLWESDPTTCASNCPFYMDHAAFARALKSLLRSLEQFPKHF